MTPMRNPWWKAGRAFFWASDFPHSGHVSNCIEELEEMAGKLSPPARPKVLGENVAKLYKLAI